MAMHLYEVAFNGTGKSVAADDIPVYSPPAGPHPYSSLILEAAQDPGPASEDSQPAPASGAYASDFLDRILAIRATVEAAPRSETQEHSDLFMRPRNAAHRQSCGV